MVPPAPMDVLVAHHGYCFDGAASAAVFTRFLRETRAHGAVFRYRGLMYEPGAPPPGDKLEPHAVNAVLDYRYTTSPRLAWYFDHHVSAFQEPGSEAHFRADASGQKFHDGTYGSCTRLIVDVARERFAWEAPDLGDLVHWSDVIDAARFPDAETACSLDHPALVLAAVVQEQGDDTLCAALVPLLASQPLGAIAALPQIESRLAPLRARHAALEHRMDAAGEQKHDVAVFDLSDQPLDSVSKFYGYKLFPTALYTVVLSRTPRRIKISVGFNPWAARPRKHNIATLCERHGGGGHPVVGAISLPPHELPRARHILDELVRTLNS